VEIDPPGVTKQHAISPYELATRLSYFLWASTPDDQLLAAADATGAANLSKPTVFASEMNRMLADSKADALTSNLGGQWFNLRALATVDLGNAFPSFDDALRAAMASETQLFFRNFLQGDRSVLDMFDAGFTFANDRLAKHYGLPTLVGSNMRQVSLTGTQRFGLLSQASVLTLTSTSDRSSPVHRGKWVLDKLLCESPPPPPMNIPSLEQTKARLPANATTRQLLEAHRAEPRCAGCHVEMDTIGYGLEHYDSIGAWRNAYANNTIDATGELPGGIKFDGALQLSQA
jgi:hypothetical protein